MMPGQVTVNFFCVRRLATTIRTLHEKSKLSPDCSKEEGATLLELVVAAALLALLCTYALGALKYLRNFNRVIQGIEEASSADAVATHLRRTIEATRPVFFGTADGSPQLAFSGDGNRIALVADADNQLEYGGLYLVQFTLAEDDRRKLIAYRRPFRPQMPHDGAGAEPIPLDDGVASLGLRYFGSLADEEEPQWHSEWHSPKALPLAVEVTLDAAAPFIVSIPAAR